MPRILMHCCFLVCVSMIGCGEYVTSDSWDRSALEEDGESYDSVPLQDMRYADGVQPDKNGDTETENPGEDDSATEVTSLRIQVIGDSHLAFNGRRSTGHQLRDVLSERGYAPYLRNHAVGGATLGCGTGEIGDPHNCIPDQYQAGEWSHILLTGGGNDVLESGCNVEVDDLLSATFDSGLMHDMVDSLLDHSEHVILLGYVDPLEPNGEAASCDPLKILMNRYQAYGEASHRVTFIDTRDAFDRFSPELYADDIHTSIEGSRRLAEHIADTMQWIDSARP